MKTHKHNLSNYKLASMPAGVLCPIGLTLVNPGDTFQHSTSALIRLDPMVAPTMHPLHAKIHHYFVPFRLLWDEWEDFITGGDYASVPPEFPYMVVNQASGMSKNDPLCYMGMPASTGTSESQTFRISALPLRAYNMCYNEYYRDQDLMTEANMVTTSGVDNTTNRSMLSVAWERDYFTTARPWEQKGVAVSVPVSVGNVGAATRVPVKGIGTSNGTNFTNSASTAVRESGDTTTTTYTPFYSSGVGSIVIEGGSGGTAAYPDIRVELDDVNVNLEDLRLGFALKRFEEMRALYGSRYTEYLRYLGIKSSDARLQRPEYLGGGKQTIQMSEILQTAEGTDPVGTLRGHGIGALRSNKYRRFFEEHGYVVSFMIIRPITMYYQGIPNHFLKDTKEAFWQKELEHIGHQVVQNQEVYAYQTDALKAESFGFVPRYEEYRGINNSVAGDFVDSLKDWHMAREFTSAPTLDGSFVTATPTQRIFAVPSTLNPYKVMISHHLVARRLVTNNISSFVR